MSRMREFVFTILIGTAVLLSAFKIEQDNKDFGQNLALKHYHVQHQQSPIKFGL